MPATRFVVKSCQYCSFTKLHETFFNHLFLQLQFFPLQEHSRVVPISNWFHSLSCKPWFFLKCLILQIVIFYITGAQSCRLYQQPGRVTASIPSSWVSGGAASEERGEDCNSRLDHWVSPLKKITKRKKTSAPISQSKYNFFTLLMHLLLPLKGVFSLSF